MTYVSDPKADMIPEVRSLQKLLLGSVDVSGVFMKSMDLEAAHGGTRSPIELLQTVEAVFKRPFADEGYATAVLVPLRESIKSTIDELLKRRPVNEKTRGFTNKVKSIVHHFGNNGMSPEHIDRVAESTHAIINDPSASKNRHMNLELISALFMKVFPCFKTFSRSLTETNSVMSRSMTIHRRNYISRLGIYKERFLDGFVAELPAPRSAPW